MKNEDPINKMMGTLPVRCRTLGTFLRLMEVIKRLDDTNSRFPMSFVIASGPDDLETDAVRWVEVYCASVSKRKHLQEEMIVMTAFEERIEKHFSLVAKQDVSVADVSDVIEVTLTEDATH